MRSNLLAPARRARRIPLKRRDIERVERNLKALVADPQHGQNRDAEFSGFVARQFERVYGTGLAEPDATGRARPAVPIRADIEVFRPIPRRTDLSFGRGVGPGEANQPADVMRAQRLLSNAGAFAFAVPEERSGRPSPALDRATRQFQASWGLTVDGRITKGGETLRGLDATLFAADEAKEPPDEEFPEEPPEGVEPEEPPKKPSDPKDPEDPPKKPEDSEKDKEDKKRKKCEQLSRDIANISEQKKLVLEQIKAANKKFVTRSDELTALIKKRRDSAASTAGSGLAGALTGGPAGAARNILGSGPGFFTNESEIRENPKKWRKLFGHCKLIGKI